MTRRLSSGRPARSARPVIDAHGHLLVPEANALADGHPGEAADAAAERASFTEASIAANQAQIRRVWPQLADPLFDPVWAAAADLGAVVFIHPWGCSLGPRLGAHFLGNTFGQPAETALALSHLIFGGVLDRHPGLRLLAAHGGGFLPTYIGRSDHAWAERPDARGCAHPPSAYLRRIWYDALVYSPQALRHLVEVVGSDKVMLGTDYPFDMGVTDPVERAAAAGLPASDLTAILSGNAVALFGISESGHP